MNDTRQSGTKAPRLVQGLPYIEGPRFIRCAGCGCQLLRSPVESPADPKHCSYCWLRIKG